MRLVVGCRRKHDDDDDEKEECFVFALWWCCCVAVWIKWKNKGKKQLSEYQRQCHVFLTNESLVRQEKSPHAEKTLNRGVKNAFMGRGCEIIFPLGAYITTIKKLNKYAKKMQQ